MQNPDGGFASYELVRGPSWVELFNPSGVFSESIPIRHYTVPLLIRIGNLMVENEYPECTTSVIGSLFIFRNHYNYRAEEIE